MELKLDPGVPYALALEGGGARGAYQIGAWRALREAGIQINAVSGTSVGALNGALIAMGDLERAEEVWQNIRYSQVIDVDDEDMGRLVKGDWKQVDLRSTVTMLKDTLANRGLDVRPLTQWIRDLADEDAIRNSPMELYIVTYSLSDRKELELRARDLPEGAIADMLLASAYLPVFRNEKLLGKRYTDGGVRDVLPLHVLLENGYENIIALRLHGFGLGRLVRIPRNVKIHSVKPAIDLGTTLEFDAERSRVNLKAGYYDAQRLLYGLKGGGLYVDSQWPEDKAYGFLVEYIRPCLAAQGQTVSLRKLNESVLPDLARRLEARSKDYDDLLIACLEAAAAEAELERFCIYTEDELIVKLQGRFAPENCPQAIAQALTPRRKTVKLL